MIHLSQAKLISVIMLLVFSFQVNATELNNHVNKMAKELEQKCKVQSRLKVAVLQFRTSNNKLTPFNKYIQDELVMAYSNSQKIEVIDINATNKILEELNWSLTNTTDFNFYQKISKAIFSELGIVPGAFIYGQINDNDETITLTGNFVPNGLKSTNIQSIVRFNSNEQTDKLLGKPVVIRPKKEVEKEVIYKEKIVEKEVPIYIEKEVIREKEVIKEIEPKEEPQSDFIKKINQLKIEIVSAYFNGNSIVVTVLLTNDEVDQSLPYSCSFRFFDDDGNEFGSTQNSIFDTDLIAGIPAKRTITFHRDGISAVKNLRALEFNLSGIGKVQFRNIPVTR